MSLKDEVNGNIMIHMPLHIYNQICKDEYQEGYKLGYHEGYNTKQKELPCPSPENSNEKP